MASFAADTSSSADGITLRGRRIFVNLTVDKDTASTLTLDKQSDSGKTVGKDRRNLYLKGEGRVDNEGENTLWDQLPEQDKMKRQKAWSEKNAKLRSPIFFISPTRLSIRNVAKDVDERSLKNSDGAPSRGYGFVEFLHHAHALACLRELNNNTAYSEEYVTGGRQAMSQKGRKPKKKRKTDEETEVKVPRLIVEFVVENRAKAKKQSDHKVQQRANAIKQKIEHKEKSGDDAEKKREKKKSRGQRQRERKRKQKEKGGAEASDNEESPAKKAKLSEGEPENRKKDAATPKAETPSKKRKVDKSEESLSKLVGSYQESISATTEAEKKLKPSKKVEKRWFEE